MGGIVNLIKKLFSGIFSFVTGLLPGKKSSGGYYLELNEAEAGKSAPAAEAPKPAVKPEATKEAAPVATAKAEPAKVADVAATNGSQPTATAAALNLPQPKVTFAEAAMTPQPTNGRRRPGANMNSYLEMARGMKTARN